MKRTIWKLLIAGVIATTALVGCKDERDHNMVDDTISFVNEEQYVGVSIYNGNYELAILKNGKGLQSAKAVVSVSETALDQYNTDNGTNYTLLPADCFKLSTSVVGFSDSDIRKYIQVIWDEQKMLALDESIDYVIPLQLTVNNDALVVDENRDVKIINFKRAALGMEEEVADGMNPTANHELFNVEGNITLNYAITKTDLTVDYKIDNTLIAAYNAANGTNFTAAPEGFATLEANSSQIAAGEVSAPFKLKVNSDVLFTGNTLKEVGSYLVPVRITSTSLEGVTITIETMYIPFTMDKEVKGPWTVLEGADNCYALDPNNGGAAWIMQYTADRLFDGSFSLEWISLWMTNNTYPMAFVLDMGDQQVFTKFRIGDSYNYQGNALDYEIYTAEAYDGANTVWNLVASGKRSYQYVSCGTDKTDPRLIYDYPAQKMIAGRYLKFVIVNVERYDASGDYQYGRCKLSDVQGVGF